ncbi:hypothetical protein GNI_119190 [Gregarina niphandrodes]|uniref:Uncharacterized protein n=1 Tax=Gregarina niphandrodes TaxID=110365 RepID=A0A023B2K1_GRENI|nr:hypothetical protein GNI_119190 [Gregarina niphandrodes]EZG55050.1 hypothetical protein GNI_119190 [Gregarina niphandrodes]|eukprot:XP_011131817.1 hypothetical protein GNI_119190 [Gregarina niphandrodes]
MRTVWSTCGGSSEWLSCLLSIKLGCGPSECVNELYLVRNYWRTLNESEFNILMQDVTAGRSARSQECARRWSQFYYQMPAEERSKWTTGGEDPERSFPLYIPTLGTMTNTSRKIGIFSDDFRAHTALREVVEEKAWKRFRRISPQHVANCNLRYLELGAILLLHFVAPLGEVHTAIRNALLNDVKMSVRPKQNRLWFTGCLLQLAGVSVGKLARFCVTKLRVAPRSYFYCLQIDRRNHIRVSSMNSQQTEKDLTDLLLQLSNLPTLTAEQFFALKPSTTREEVNLIASNRSAEQSAEQSADVSANEPLQKHPLQEGQLQKDFFEGGSLSGGPPRKGQDLLPNCTREVQDHPTSAKKRKTCVAAGLLIQH